MNAADVLAEARDAFPRDPRDINSVDLTAALLAHGEQGVAILPDGTLWALESVEAMVDGHAEWVWRELSLSAEAGDTETDVDRDRRFQLGNDATWGAGNWVRCPSCPPDDKGRQPYHHRNAHPVSAEAGDTDA